MKIDRSDLARNRELRKIQDDFAYRLGVLRAEFLMRERQILDGISQTDAKLKAHGEDSLKRCGIDPEAADYRIVEDGDIQRLENGVWVDID